MEDWIENHRLESTDKIISEINEIIQKHNIESNTDGKSTTGSNSSQYELGSHIKEFSFAEPLAKIVESTLQRKDLLSSSEKVEICNLWAVYGGHGAFHRIHRHNELGVKHYSMVVYTHVDQSEDEISGAFFAVLNTEGENDFIEFAPETGDILIFPVWICHGTYPQSSQKRITLNLDFKTVSC